MAKKQFKAESKRLLDLMIHSIYTHKEIFLRELISNGSDAIDKLYYRSLTDANTGLSREDFSIAITIDKEKRTLTIADNGCGMSKEDMENNLGTIAKSGSLAFKNENEVKADIDIIGQFGVGFYAAFMVSDTVTVTSKAFGSEDAFVWKSSGADGYAIDTATKDTHGTEIVLKIKENEEDESYDEYLDTFRIKSIVKKYSDYIRYPIKMDVEKRRPKSDDDKEMESYIEVETLNSMVPIWKKSKSELQEDDYNNFYKEKFHDFNDPMKVIHSNAEGMSTYNALMFIPAKAPYNYYTRDYEKGLQLYSNGVMIMDKCADLLPDYFGFVKGLVDSQDLSLNISRELLQHDRQLKAIATRLEKKIKSELESLLKNDREKYDEFFQNFGLQLKFGMQENYGMNKDTLKDLILFHSSSEKKNVTLAEYVSRMKEEQKDIYYAVGETVEKIDKAPQTEMLKDKGFEILYLTQDIDEFAIKMLFEYDGKQFKSASDGGLDVQSDEEKEEIKKKTEDNKGLFELMKEALGDKIKEVRFSTRLKTHPVCISTDGELSLEMEKILNAMPTDNKVKAERVLEINENHPVFATLQELNVTDKEKVKKYANLLYNQALLIEGMSIEDPVAFSNAICDLMV